MRESQLQTPQIYQIIANRRSKSTPDASMKNRKSLNPAFAAISKEKVSDFANETAEFGSPIHAVSVDSPVNELSENSVNLVDSAVISTPETIVPSNQSSSSSSKSMITSDEYAVSVASVPKCENLEPDSIKNTLPIEVKVVIKHLSAARTQVLNSTIEYKSKKVLDVLLETIIKEFHGGPWKERDLVDQLFTREAILIFLSFTFGVLAVFLFLMSGESGHSMRPPPT